MGVLVATLVLGSLGLSAAIVAARPRAVVARRLALVGTWTLAALSLALIVTPESAWQLGQPWVPGTEPVSLSAGPSNVAIIIMVQSALALAVTVDLRRGSEDAGGGHFMWLAPLLSGLVVAGLAVDQFLARYAALEALALVTVLTYALEPGNGGTGRSLWGWYWLFRLGDAGLILLILALHRASGTFLIDPMLSTLQAMPQAQQLALLSGGLLAGWVKLGLPPFHGWLLAGAGLPWWRSMWVTGIGLPSLGAYLLYRLGPALVASGARPALILGAVLVTVSILSRLGRVARSGERACWLLAAHGAVGIALAGSGVMAAYMVTLVPIRIALVAAGSRRVEWGPLARPGAVALPDLGTALGALVRAMVALEAWLEGLVIASADAVLGLALWLQRRHSGRLRANLLWACVGVLATIAASMAAGQGVGAP